MFFLFFQKERQDVHHAHPPVVPLESVVQARPRPLPAALPFGIGEASPQVRLQVVWIDLTASTELIGSSGPSSFIVESKPSFPLRMKGEIEKMSIWWFMGVAVAQVRLPGSGGIRIKHYYITLVYECFLNRLRYISCTCCPNAVEASLQRPVGRLKPWGGIIDNEEISQYASRQSRTFL
jgi:hypothetical protein